ncbi:ComEA family DNA-binding protein [Sulfurimonas sp.]
MKIFIGLIIGFSLLLASIDINNAGKSQLMGLSGVGAKKADAIIKYRKANCFKSVNELMKVKGLGQKFVEKNKKSIKVGKCKK